MKTSTNLILVCFSLLVASSLASSPSEIQALMDFYNSTNGPYWTNNANWGKGDPCYYNWYGVTCSQDNSEIVGLSLYSNRIAGSFPESFGQLSNLKELSITSAKLYGTFPQSFSNLTSLTDLDLNGNAFTGSFPEFLFNLPALRRLNLATNAFSGQLPDKFDSFANIETVYLGSNVFSGSIPPTILNNLPNCQVSIGNCFFTSLPWDKWTNKLTVSNTTFDFSSNQLSGSLTYQIYWPKSINLANNIFTGTLPELNMTTTPTITGISLGSNQLSGNLPVSLTQASYITGISVEYNRAMSGVVPFQYASMPYLRSLTFYGTGLTCPKGNSQWDNFAERAYVSCPYHEHDYLALYIVLYIGGIFFLLGLAGLIIFCALRKPNNVIVVA